MSEASLLSVLLHGKPIGAINRLPGDRTIFTFEDAYVEDRDRPTLSLSFKNQYGELLTESRTYQTRLHPFFSNLLPEGPLREYLASRAGVKPSREFALLQELGLDLPGALTAVPALEGNPAATLEVPADESGQAGEQPLRFSLAGVQLKFSALKNPGKGGGLTILAGGTAGDWIVKLPSLTYEAVPENEYAMMKIAEAIGIHVPDIDLVHLDQIDGLPSGMGVGPARAFIIRRFDRSESGAVHMEDFAQVFGVYPDGKYDRASYRNIATVLGIETDETSISQFIRRLVFSTLIGNADMHLKNWSLIYPDGRRPILSPAYDLLSTIPYIPDENASLTYARTKRMAELDYDELAYLADKARLSETAVLGAARETVDAFFTFWAAEKLHFELPGRIITAIDDHLAKLAICR